MSHPDIISQSSMRTTPEPSNKSMQDAGGTPRSIKLFANEILFQPGSTALHFYLVKTGQIQIWDLPKRHFIARYRAGDIFGLAEVLAGLHWPYTAMAGVHTNLLQFPKSQLMRSLAGMPHQHQAYLDSLLSAG